MPKTSDTAERYGRITRILHWGMAVLFIWMALTVGLRMSGIEAPFAKALWSTHQQVGFVLLLLAAARITWAWLQRRTRPTHTGAKGKLVQVGHGLLYAGMIVVPALALLRSYGSGWGFGLLGLEIVPGAEKKVEFLTWLGSALHGELGLALFALIAGHIAMAVFHARVLRDETFKRMAS